MSKAPLEKLPQSEGADYFIVLDPKEGIVHHAYTADLGRSFGHEHIKDAQLDGVTSAARWVVRPLFATNPAAGELAPLQVGLQEPALVVLPEEIPASNTLWMFLTKGMTQSAIAGMPERDRKVLTERAQENWAAIRAEVGATVPVVLPEPVTTITSIDECGPCLGWFEHWANYPIGTKLYTEQQMRALLAGVSAPAAVAVLDYPWRDRLLDGRELVRDQQGFAEHSELPLLDEGMKPRAFFAALGVEMKHTMADDDLSMDEYDAMSDAENWSAWIPRPPIGDAWNLVAIFDTEDGPAAWWARALKESREASPQAQADARDAAPAASGQDARVQWWLATLDQYGNPTLTDGAHQARAGADKAAYLIDAMNLGRGKKYSVARVELSEPKPSSDGVNHEAIAIHKRSAQAAQQGGDKQ